MSKLSTSRKGGILNPSFSSISFETESAIKFKKRAKDQDKTHTQLLNELME